MSWTAPRTWVTNEIVTAAMMNTHVRDNLSETAPAKVTTAGDLVYATGANALTRLGIGSVPGLLATDGSAPVWRRVVFDDDFSDGSASQTESSTTYTPTVGGQATSFPNVTATTGTRAIVLVGCEYVSNDTAGGQCIISYSVSGATTSAASDGRAAMHESSNANDAGHVSLFWLQSLTAGSNTFQMEGRVTTGTGTFVRPRILVIPL